MTIDLPSDLQILAPDPAAIAASKAYLLSAKGHSTSPARTRRFFSSTTPNPSPLLKFNLSKNDYPV